MQCYQDWASARQRTLEKPAGLSVPPSKKARNNVSMVVPVPELKATLSPFAKLYGRRTPLCPGSSRRGPGRQDGGASSAWVHVPTSLAGTWRAVGTKLADKTVAVTSCCHLSFWPPRISPGIYPAFWRVV